MPVTDEDAAGQAIGDLDPLSAEQQEAISKLKTILDSNNPFVDIHELFALYSTLYFRSLLLPRVEISWSPRLTLCAGICELVRDPNKGNKFTRIRLKLSEPLLKFRPRSDVIDTLLHEAIHAYFFVTTSWHHSRGEDGTGHGEGFLMLADAVNNHGGYSVSVFHTFHDEVDSYRTHVWECNGPCKSKAPFFGLVKRSMNRTPGKGDSWWAKHLEECGGSFSKIAEPEMRKDQVERLSALQRAGKQKNKIDAWLVGQKRSRSPGEVDGGTNRSHEPGRGALEEQGKRERLAVSCPISEAKTPEDAINEHLDELH